MTPAEVDQLVRRANAAGFCSLAEYTVSLERALIQIAERPSRTPNEAVLIARDCLFGDSPLPSEPREHLGGDE